ncbi:hypothetical protein [Paenibacillus sp. HWE-109]|nr:hypothetical protein [Paenibacillus sp. HWE-109]
MRFQLPWDSSLVLQAPWVLPVTLVVAAVLLSIITWFKPRKK